ncbi:decaprenyl-phosphate phosphoribosyltransferase [bacterium]|nr:decaprenyl-phosphate phosphoribosyltransferase [bacterium]
MGFCWNILQSVRPRQWSKNLLVFAGLVFAEKLGDPERVLESLLAFCAFCAFSASVYLLNDILDRERDRLHPVKCKRPLAAGRLSVSAAAWSASALALAGLLIALSLGPAFVAVSVAYLLLTGLYSWRLKRVVLLDVMLVAAGFVLRVLGGTVAIAVETSHWIILCTFLLSLFLGFAKRRHELTLLEGEADSHRAVLVHYSPYFLDQMISIVTTSTLLCYILYTLSPETVAHVGSTHLVYTVPFVIYGIFRYLYLIHQKRGGGDPTLLLFADRSLLLDVAAWLAAALVVLYL